MYRSRPLQAIWQNARLKHFHTDFMFDTPYSFTVIMIMIMIIIIIIIDFDNNNNDNKPLFKQVGQLRTSSYWQ